MTVRVDCNAREYANPATAGIFVRQTAKNKQNTPSKMK